MLIDTANQGANTTASHNTTENMDDGFEGHVLELCHFADGLARVLFSS